MKIILLDKIQRLGEIGDVVEVNSGYARNFLIPQKKTAFALQLRYFGAQRLGRWLKATIFKQKLVKIPPP